jgi:putative ABC transport system permease protein
MVKAAEIKDVQKISEQIQAMGFQTSSLNDMIEHYKKQSAQLQAIFGGIGAVSLLVAAIGITNTMIMSIYERTREIGVMKVIGAALSDVRRLFLFEAGLIGFLGGVLGLGFSYGVSFILNSSGMQFLGGMGFPGSKISIIPVWLTGSAMLFTTLVGLISGFYPAHRAMKLSPLEAIRTE